MALLLLRHVSSACYCICQNPPLLLFSIQFIADSPSQYLELIACGVKVIASKVCQIIHIVPDHPYPCTCLPSYFCSDSSCSIRHLLLPHHSSSSFMCPLQKKVISSDELVTAISSNMVDTWLHPNKPQIQHECVINVSDDGNGGILIWCVKSTQPIPIYLMPVINYSEFQCFRL